MSELNSQNPNKHDNTEKDLILITPAVLDNKLRDLESYGGAKESIQGDIAQVVTLFVAVFTVVEFKDPLPPIITASTIQGAFLVGLVLMILKTGVDFLKMKSLSHDIHTRAGIIQALLGEDLKTPEKSRENQRKKTDSTKK